MASLEAGDAVPDCAESHGAIPFAVSLYVDAACSRSAFHLGNAVAGAGKIDGHGEHELLRNGDVDIILRCLVGVECIFANVEKLCPHATSKRFLHFVGRCAQRNLWLFLLSRTESAVTLTRAWRVPGARSASCHLRSRGVSSLYNRCCICFFINLNGIYSS